MVIVAISEIDKTSKPKPKPKPKIGLTLFSPYEQGRTQKKISGGVFFEVEKRFKNGLFCGNLAISSHTTWFYDTNYQHTVEIFSIFISSKS